MDAFTAVIAVSQVALAIAVWFIRPRVVVNEAPRRYPTVYIPVQCGLPKTVGGITDSCVRRRCHTPPCLTDTEVENAAEVGSETQVVPAVPESSAPVDMVEFGKHVKECPASLFIADRMSQAELVWLHKTRVMVDDMVERSRFTEWEPTRG